MDDLKQLRLELKNRYFIYRYGGFVNMEKSKLESTFIGMKESDFELIGEMNDHELADWLNKHGWQAGFYHSIGNATMFYNDSNQIIAIMFFDNVNYTKKVYLRKD
jgi:hypothetical protein